MAKRCVSDDDDVCVCGVCMREMYERDTMRENVCQVFHPHCNVGVGVERLF